MVKKRTSPNRGEDYALYRLWRALPKQMKNLAPAELAKLGIEDHQMLELLQIKTQTEYCQRYGIGINTLSRWNKRIAEDPKSHAHMVVRLAREMLPTVFHAFTLHTIKHGDAARTALWLAFAGLNKNAMSVPPKQTFDVVGFIEQIEERNRRIRAKIANSSVAFEDEDDEPVQMEQEEERVPSHTPTPAPVNDGERIKKSALWKEEIEPLLKRCNDFSEKM